MFLELVAVSVVGTVLVGGQYFAGGRRVVGGLDTRADLSTTDLDLTVAGLCVLCPGMSVTDLDLGFATFPAPCFSVLGTDGLRSAVHKLVLDFQIEPIFDWIILPLYIPGAAFNEDTATGGFGACATILVCLTACSERKAWVCV